MILEYCSFQNSKEIMLIGVNKTFHFYTRIISHWNQKRLPTEREV